VKEKCQLLSPLGVDPVHGI